jgi:hypothetical protein
VAINIPADDQTFKFCNQDLADYRSFPPILFAVPANQPRGGEWMSEAQNFARIFGIISFWLMVLAFASVFNRIRRNAQIIFWRPRPTTEWTSPIKFSRDNDCSGYIPSATIETEPFPVLFCDVRDLPSRMMSWTDPRHPDYRVHCALTDLPGLAEKPIFSTVHYWPPPEEDHEEGNGAVLK